MLPPSFSEESARRCPRCDAWQADGGVASRCPFCEAKIERQDHRRDRLPVPRDLIWAVKAYRIWSLAVFALAALHLFLVGELRLYFFLFLIKPAASRPMIFTTPRPHRRGVFFVTRGRH